MKVSIYDVPKQGIDLEYDMENGTIIKIFMDYKSAKDMINIIQNKLNGIF